MSRTLRRRQLSDYVVSYRTGSTADQRCSVVCDNVLQGNNFVIRKVTLAGAAVSTFAGVAGSLGSNDGVAGTGRLQVRPRLPHTSCARAVAEFSMPL